MVDLRSLGTAAISVEGDRRLGLLAHPDSFALLCLIALEGPMPREALARLLGESSGEYAYAPAADRDSASLLPRLFEPINAALGSGVIRVVDDSVALAAEVELNFDVARFQRRISEQRWGAALREYTGRFLEDLPTLSFDGLERWRQATSERLAERADAARARVTEAGVGTLEDPPRSALSRFMDHLRQRVVYQVAVVYVMAAWAALQVVDMLVDRDKLGQVYFDVTLLAAISGLALVVLFAWARRDDAESIGENPDTPGPWPRWVRRPRTLQATLALAVALLVLVSAAVALREFLPESSTPRTADPTSIAVLYFDDFSPGGTLGPVANGFTNDLIDQLDDAPGMEVRSLSAVRPFRGGRTPLDSIFERLNVGAIVEGGLASSGDSMRVSVRLVVAADSGPPRTVASTRLVGAAGSELTLGAELAAEVARLLREELGVEIRLRQMREQTDSDEAWLLVQRGVKLRDDAADAIMEDQQAAIDMLTEADSLFVEAEGRDPDWIEPILQRGWTAHQRALTQSEVGGSYERPWAREALRHANRALRVDPGNAAAYELRGEVRFGLVEVTASEQEAEDLRLAAERDLLAALRADPDRARAARTLGALYRRDARLPEAFRYLRQALRADHYFSQAPSITYDLYSLAHDLGRRADAREHCAEGRRRWPEDARFYICPILLLKSYGTDSADVGVALEWRDSLIPRWPEPQRPLARRVSLMWVAGVAAKAGMADSARALITEAREPEPHPVLTYDEAHAWLLMGEADRALDRLEEYLDYRPDRRDFLAEDWWFEPLHQHPRFLRLTGQLGDA